LLYCRKSRFFFIICMQQAYNNSQHHFANNLTEIFPYPLLKIHWNIWNFLWTLKVKLFSILQLLFPAVFSCQILWNSDVWFSRNKRTAYFQDCKFSFNHNFSYLLRTHSLHLTGFFQSKRKSWKLLGSFQCYFF